MRRGVRFVGIEIEPDYFRAACQRIDEASRQPGLLQDQVPTPAPLQGGLPIGDGSD